MNRKFHTVTADIAAGKFDDSTKFILDGIAEFHDSLLGREINQSGHCRFQPGNAKCLMTDTEVNPVPLESVIKREESGDGMKSFCGLCALLMLAMLCVDIMTDASFGQTVFHLFLFFVNVICTNIDD